MNIRDVLFYFVCKYEDNYFRQIQALNDKEEVDEELLKSYKEKYKALEYVTVIDDDYPEELRCDNAPLVLFFGNKDHTVMLRYPSKALIYITY